ncbi:MAG: hypothetical protein M3Z16_08620 [Pseudomonadota bacterium]|nr:hypothetical protein [Pseudomonadota bacterium]
MNCFRFLGLLCALAGPLVLGGCASADKRAMTVDAKTTTVAKHHPYTVGVLTAGGVATGGGGNADITSDDLKAAIEASIKSTQVFREVVEGKTGQYLLEVNLVNMTRPSFGFSFTVEVELAWTLTRSSDGKVVLRKSIPSTYTAGAGDAFAGAVRLRMAVEGAARANIALGMKEIGSLDL